MDEDACVPVHDMSYEAYDLIAAVFEATALADALDAGAMDLVTIDHVETLQSSLADMHDPDRVLMSMTLPKRFYKRYWQSFSLRLLNRCTQTAKPSKWARQVP